MTNEHIVTKKLIEQEATINVYYDQLKNSVKIVLNPYERIIREFTYMDIDATVIEILPKDNIDQEFFLLPHIKYMYDINQLPFKEITIIQYPNGKLNFSNGKIGNITNYTFSHSAATLPGSSGSPIFLKNSNKVIGIHKSFNGDEDNPENYGNIIGPIFKYIKNFPIYNKCELNKSPSKLIDVAKKLMTGNDENKKIEYEDWSYYIGQIKNDKPNGKGTKYDKNGIIKYKGDFINGKMGGKGQFYYDIQDYYIGQMKND